MASIAGNLLYRLYHRPAALIRECVREGGPWQQRRTAQGRREMEAAARQLPLLPTLAGPAIELHLLTGQRFWDQSEFCLWTFARASRRSVAPIIYDDGTLTSEHRDLVLRLFPIARFVSVQEARQRLDVLLPAPRFPFLRDRWQQYPNIRKLIDPHLGRSGWKLVIDSDLLFFRRPELLITWADCPVRPLHAIDSETSYGYSRPLLESLAEAPLSELVNVGLCGLNSIELDWEKIEHWCRTLIEREGTHYFLEQALVAMLVAGRPCDIAPASDYVTLPRPPEASECRAVMHHYVAESKRWYFRDNWRRALVLNE